LDFLFAFLDDFGILTVPFGLGDLGDDDFETLEQDLYFTAGKGLPGDVEFDEPYSAEFDEKRQVKFFHDVSLDDEIPKDNLSRPNTYFEVLFAEVFNVLSHDLGEQSFHQRLKHMICDIILSTD
jgi:hypothetical protein